MIRLAAAALLLASGYQREIEQWRAARETQLKSDTGWLTLVALEWLGEGENRFPSFPGVFARRGAEVTHALPEKPARAIQPGQDILRHGSREAFIIVRGGRYAVRVRDSNAETRTGFTGLRYFPIDERWRITAGWVAEATILPIANILGTTERMHSPGYATFHIDGKQYRLRPVLEAAGAKELFFIFRDRTSRGETYGAGRFLYAAMPQDGKVVLDFNKAYNPPCAFTAYATCPLPPKENQLPIRVPAGELRYEQAISR
jgi:uncharacterized protein (DUF1684 family)